MRSELKLVSKFDTNRNGRLDTAERQAAREFVAKERAEGGAVRGPGGRFRTGNQTPPEPGPRLNPSEVKIYSDQPLYDETTLRTFFLEFENSDWEKELVDFHNTDVEVPAKLIVDGKTYPDVGVHFRGVSSFGVGEGRKRSLNISLDFVDENQRLGGYRTLNLLNAANDPTLIVAVLYFHVAREYGPAPKANYARVVINGESWGIYPNVQQFNKDFIREWFGTTQGARWKAPGSPGGRAGLEYLGEEVAEYKKVFEIKSKDDPKAWASLIHFCRVLNETPSDKLEAALKPLLDIDETLKFLALENVFINTDAYWARASDYNLYQDPKGRFHIIPHDVNESLRAPEGGRNREQPGRGLELDPLVAANDAKKPLISKLLAVPALRTRYLRYVHDLAEKWLAWERLAPLAAQYQGLIDADMKVDTRKLSSYESFTNNVAGVIRSEAQERRAPPMTLKSFAEQRRAFLLQHPEVMKAMEVKKAGG